MKAKENPFKPTAGGEPPLLIGRGKVIRDFEKGLDNGVGAPGRIMLVTGARGTGKTVMLTVFGDRAKARRWDVIEETASAGLCERLVDALRTGRGALDHLTIRPSLTFAGAGIGLGEAELSPKRMPETLRSAIAGRLDALEKRHAGLLITIVFAGVPQMISDLFNDEVITFLRRAKTNILTDIPLDEVRDAFATTFRASGMSITDAQLSTAANVTAGYPYMIQLVGYHIWDAADMRDSDTIIDADVTAGIEEARIDLDNAVCIPELHGLSKNDRKYLEAMAASDGPSPTVNVAQRMGKTPNYAATYRKRLLDAFVIRETERGEVDFAVPFLREYLRRNQ